LVDKYHFDGLVFDDTAYTSWKFVKRLREAGNVFIAGDMSAEGVVDVNHEGKPSRNSSLADAATTLSHEDLDDAVNLDTSLAYAVNTVSQEDLDSAMNLPLYHRLIACFAQKDKASLQNLGTVHSAMGKAWAKLAHNGSLVINYVEGLSLPRIASLVPDLAMRKNILLYLLCAEGLPVITYGVEQESLDLTYSSMPPMWYTKFETKTGDDDSTYQYIARIGKLRREMKPDAFLDAKQETVYATSDMFVFIRGKVLVAVTNVGSGVSQIQAWVDVKGIWEDGTVVCNLMWIESDCMTVENGHIDIRLLDGEGALYALRSPPPRPRSIGRRCKDSIL
jgi:hypothetical protein